MDPRRLRIGEWLTGLGGAVLLASTFLHWYDVSSDGTHTDQGILFAQGSVSAWEAFSVVDILLTLLAALAIGTAVMTAAHNTPAVGLALASLTALVGLLATIAVIVRLLAMPEFAIRDVTVPDDDVSLAIGAWIGLASAVVTTLGAFAAMRSERYPRAARADVPIEAIPPPEAGKA